MNESNSNLHSDNRNASQDPGSEPTGSLLRELYAFLSSAKLAMFLLVVILVLCLAGVTILRGPQAGTLIFNTLWFNSILVLLVLNVCFCFFGRIWGRKLTLVSFGMILFHLSFVALFAGIIYNSLFFFRGEMRLTEGETLTNGQFESFDTSERGILFDLSRFKGETTLTRLHKGYKVNGEDKLVAYEISVGQEGARNDGILYITHGFDYKGFRYFCDREGYSVLTILLDGNGKEIYGAHIPLQSLKQKDETFLYTTGNRNGPQTMPFPQMTKKPVMDLQVIYHPANVTERSGDVTFAVWPLLKSKEKHQNAQQPSLGLQKTGKKTPSADLPQAEKGTESAGGWQAPDPHASLPGQGAGMPSPHTGVPPADMATDPSNSQRPEGLPVEKPLARGTVPIGKVFRVGTHNLLVKEVRYWVVMHVSYEPGLPIVLASLWVGLGGMIITFVGRMQQRRKTSASGSN